MNLKDLTLTKNDLTEFASVLEATFVGTGVYFIDKGYFEVQMRYKIKLYEDNLNYALENFLDMIRYTHGHYKNLETLDRSQFCMGDFPGLLQFLWDTDMRDIPLSVTSGDIYKRVISIWRLKIGK